MEYKNNINNDNKQFNKEHCEKIQKDFKELYREMLENIKKGKTDEKIKFFLENARFYSYIDSLFNYLRIPNAYHNEKARVIKVYYAALNSIIKCIEMKSEKELSSYICFENIKKNRDNFLRYLEETKKKYLLIADVYIIGFQMDFSESDIWWLLSYKRNVNPESKVYFFQPYINDDMKLMIESYGVETPGVLFEDTNNINEDFINYYNNIFQNYINQGGQ